MAVRLFPPENGWGDDERFRSDLTLTAYFSRNAVEGVMGNWESPVNPDDDYSRLSYTIESAPIAGNGFTAPMEPAADCVNCLEVASSTVRGDFYGPSAVESGGTIQGEFVRDGVEEVGIGIFYSNR